MARLAVESERLILRLNPVEKVATFKRSIVVSLRAISDVSVQHDPWGSALLDLRLASIHRFIGEVEAREARR